MALSGTLPNDALTYVQGGLRLAFGPALAWRLTVAAVQQRYGWTPAITDGYRDYAEQKRIFEARYQTTYREYAPGKVDDRYWPGHGWYWRKPGNAAAAVPGTSNHGWGTAVDVTALDGFNGTRYKQFADVATEHGWSNAEGASVDEYWHWVQSGDVNNPPDSGGTEVSETDVIIGLAKVLDQAANRSTPTGRAVSDDLRRILTGIAVTDEEPTPAEIAAAVWATKIKRGGQEISALQEVADANTRLIAAAAKAGVEVDEEELAKALGPLIANSIHLLSDADFARIAKEVNDEEARRQVS